MKSKKKILLVIFTLMVLVIASITIYCFNTRNNDKLNNNINSADEVENTNADSATLETEEIKKENEKDVDTIESVDEEDVGLDIKENNDTKKENSDVIKKEDEKNLEDKAEQKDNVSNIQDKITNQEQNNQSIKKEEITSSNQNSNDNSNNSSNNNVSNSGVWNELGITEYEYYNTPMWSWAKITHKTKTECIDAGETAKAKELEKDESERKSVLFTCTEIYSYSGRYLGEMLEVEYLD